MTSRRYIPRSQTNHMETGAILSSIEAQRGVLQSQGYNNLPSNDSPFNPVVHADVRYHEPIVSQTNRVLSKYENRHRNMNDIALYDTHTFDLNATNISGNKIHNNMMEKARSKVVQKNTDMYLSADNGSMLSSNSGPYVSGITMGSSSPINDQREHVLQQVLSTGNVDHLFREQFTSDFTGGFTSGSFRTNGYTYNPYLPISETNKPPVDMPPVITDERMTYHTNERAWNYESDRANMAFDLQRSQEIIERNMRQHEADDALLHRTKKDRWVEDKQAYMNRPVNPYAVPYSKSNPHSRAYELTKSEQINASNQNQRKTDKPDVKKKESFNMSRAALVNGPHGSYSVTDMNHARKDIYSTHQPAFSEKMHEINQINNMSHHMKNNRPEQYKAPEKAKSVELNIFKYVTDGVKRLLGINPEQRLHEDPRELYDEDGSSTRTQETYDVYDDSMEIDKKDSIDKRRRSIVIRNGEMMEVYPDTNDATAVSYVTGDQLNGITRTIVMKEGGKYIVLQKHEEDKLFTNDHKRYGEDIIAISIPVEKVDTQTRERIRKRNMDTMRDKVLELDYNDFVMFSDYILQHIDQAERVKLESLYQHVRTNTYDADIVNNFEGRKTLLDDKVYNLTYDNLRSKDRLEHPRVDKQDYEAVVENLPVQSAPIKSGQAGGLRDIQHSNYTTRTISGMGRNVLNKFNN